MKEICTKSLQRPIAALNAFFFCPISLTRVSINPPYDGLRPPLTVGVFFFNY